MMRVKGITRNALQKIYNWTFLWALATGITVLVAISASPASLRAASPSRTFLIVSPFEIVQDEGDYRWLSTAVAECLKAIFQRLDLETVENIPNGKLDPGSFIPLTIQDVRSWIKEGPDRRADFLVNGTTVVSGEQVIVLLSLSNISEEQSSREYQIEGTINQMPLLIEQVYDYIVEFIRLKVPVEVKDEIFSNCSGSPNAFRHYGLSFHAADLEQKKAALLSAVETDPGFVPAWMQLGLVLYVLGIPQEAEESFRKVIQASPRFKEAYNNLGVVLSDSSDTEGAAEAFREALKIDNEYTDARFNLAKLLDRQKKYKEALSHYHELLKAEPERLEIRFLAALVLDKIGKYDKALEEFRLISAKDPGRAELFFMERGRESRKEKDYTAAKLFFQRALDINPDYQEIYGEMGVNSFLEGDFEKSRTFFMTAAKKIPDSAEIQHYLGLASTKIGLKDEAIAAFKRAVELQNFKESNLELGKIYLEDEHYAEAIQSLNRFLKAEPDSEEGKDMLSLATRKAEEEARVMQKKADFAGRRLDKMDEIVTDLNRRNAELETTLALLTGQSEGYKKEIERLKEEKSSREEDLRSMMQGALDMNREVAELKNRNATLEENRRRELSEIDSTRRAVDAELNALKGEYDKRIATLESKERELLSDVEELKETRARMKEATEKLRNFAREAEESKNKISLCDRKLVELEKNLLSREEEKKDLQEKLAVSDKRLQDLAREAEESKNKISLCDRKLVELEKNLLSREEEKKDLQEKLAASDKRLRDLARDVEDLKTKAIGKLQDLAEEYRRRRLFKEAMETYLLIIRLDPENGPAYFALGELFYDSREFEKSEEMFKKASSFLRKEHQ